MEILLLDDRTQPGAQIIEVLTQAGYTVSIANDLTVARLALEKNNFPIILIRWEMSPPEDDSLVKWLRKAGNQGQRYILFLALDEDVKFADVLKVGGDDLLSYPVEEDELMARLMVAERVLRLESDLRQAASRFDQHVMIDELTGLMNQRALYRFSGQELARARRSGQPLSLLVIGLDSQFIGSYTIEIRNKVLAHVAALLRNNVRPYDQLARWSGTEFLVILPDTDIAHATVVGERVLDSLKTQMLRDDAGNILDIWISAGLHTWRPGRSRIMDFDKLVREAERAMRRARQEGINRLEKSVSRVSV